MYSPDVVSLKQFYANPLGQVTATLIWRRIRSFWPQMSGESVLGFGYPIPYFPPQCEQDTLAVVGMTSQQGALYWPMHQQNRVALLDEERLPFADASFNRVLMIHVLEHSDQLRPLMQEIWRVLVPGGRILAVVPNRMGRWARTVRNPFGYGRPFSIGQMRYLLSEGGLTYLRADSALYVPAIAIPSLHRFAPYWEETCRFLLPHMGGVLLIEAEKQIYASLREPARAQNGRKVKPVPAAQPAFSPFSKKDTA